MNEAAEVLLWGRRIGVSLPPMMNAMPIIRKAVGHRNTRCP